MAKRMRLSAVLLVCAVETLLLIMMKTTAVVEGRTCGLGDVVLSNEYLGEGLCQWGLVNNCPCEASNIVANCEDRRWKQSLISPFAMAVDKPTFGRCTFFPGSSIAPATSGKRFGRTYPCPGDTIPLSLVAADFGQPCK
ncbi:hypothetical protein GOP47_0001766 [Adiantum capillus-veneris]|uniref:Uncharacterized protein n=1 Tax=Adiantum capillus-veneris TaxID=13818 RepID=A0A9D4VAC6_ADICA|nr:hypothetical protein GOP47_0001766 [Adiantum capillus-veneris]